MHIEVNKKLFARSDRVKSVDFHPTEPWVITGLYNGSVNIYNHLTGAVIKTFEIALVPVRCVRFIARKNWFVTGSDDFQLRVYNYNTHEKVTAFEAHPDYIRCLAVHPTLSLVFTGSDDMTIKSWDWDKSWRNSVTFQGHTHYIMNIAISPKDPMTFATSCLDKTVKVWSITSSAPNFTFDAHERGGVNFVEYHPDPHKPYIITTGDDRTIRIWDYLSKSCIQTLEGHTANVSFAVYLGGGGAPLIVSGSEDGMIKLWNAGTYRLENTLNYGLERAWCVSLNGGRGGASAMGSNEVAVGFDEGLVVLKLGKDEPSYSMDSSGKLIYFRGSEVLTSNLATLLEDGKELEQLPDGSRINLTSRELGSTEVFATSIQHSPNGRFVTVVGDGEYIIYTALAWRNKAFGQGSSFAWAEDSNTYAVLEGKLKVRLWKNFKEKKEALKGIGGWTVESVHGGPLLCARGNGFVVFWDWESGEIVRRIDVESKNVYWSTSGTLVAITSEDSFYILRFDGAAYQAALDSGADMGDEGCEEAFEVVVEIPENVKTAKWIGDCFIYTNAANRLNYLLGTQTNTVTQFDTPLYLLGYVPAHNRIYLVDRQMSIFAYSLSLAVVEYQTAILRRDLTGAAELLTAVPASERNKVARFLEAQDLKSLALKVTTDPEHKFELAIALDELETALALAEATPAPENEVKWKMVGDTALSRWKFGLARECYRKAGDIGASFLIETALGDKSGVRNVAKEAVSKGQNNIAFAALWQLGDPKAAVDLLIKTDRPAEAALLARTYAPCRVPKALQAWRTDLESKGKSKVANLLADPSRGQDAELFQEGWSESLAREEGIYGRATNGDLDVGRVLGDSP
ncbi:hypothetical protein M408DRAFT_330396 [Serendipita vermifera MAFF 305830]|uniref:Coatomer subunit beta' n=1 Tax=Serendipita vermifera MAFF 305830 TaxID=933852 RepID=A0A0C3B3M6_SERVB|nr:hypothetical protein M408DRAFT_330396 [Serendipita vermifera MAFF 305830]